MLEFIASVFASVLASFIFLALGLTFSRKARQAATAALSVLVDGDLLEAFRRRENVAKDLREEIAGSERVDVCTGRGQDLQSDHFSELFAGRKGGGPAVRILLPGRGTQAVPNWTERRERELSTFDTSFSLSGMLAQQIEASVLWLGPHVASKRVDVRRFSALHLGRVILLDHCCYFAPYETQRHGRNSFTLKFRSGGVTYRWLRRYFEETWATAGPE